MPAYLAVTSRPLTRTVRLTGGSSAATSNPWYLRVVVPAIVWLAYPPNPFVTSHSWFSASSRFPHTSLPNCTSPSSDTFLTPRSAPATSRQARSSRSGAPLPNRHRCLHKIFVKENEITPVWIYVENVVRARE